MLIDTHSIRLTSPSGKSAMPRRLVDRLALAADGSGHLTLTVYNRADEDWNRGARRHHPIRVALGLITGSKAGEVVVGKFTRDDEAALFRDFAKEKGYAIDGP